MDSRFRGMTGWRYAKFEIVTCWRTGWRFPQPGGGLWTVRSWPGDASRIRRWTSRCAPGPGRREGDMPQRPLSSRDAVVRLIPKRSANSLTLQPAASRLSLRLAPGCVRIRTDIGNLPKTANATAHPTTPGSGLRSLYTLPARSVLLGPASVVWLCCSGCGWISDHG